MSVSSQTATEHCEARTMSSSRERDDALAQYVESHREDLIYAIKHGDSSVRSLAIAALIRGGDAELELAKREIEKAQREQR